MAHPDAVAVHNLLWGLTWSAPCFLEGDFRTGTHSLPSGATTYRGPSTNGSLASMARRHEDAEDTMSASPNVLFFHVDNLGFGELSCYSGGPFRGVMTTRIDQFAKEGFRLTNYCPESQCTPSRSALLTHRDRLRQATRRERLSGSLSTARGRSSTLQERLQCDLQVSEAHTRGVGSPNEIRHFGQEHGQSVPGPLRKSVDRSHIRSPVCS
jgi:hypothetical protein